ncbi:phosphodiester glycosidase family protein [filamentous cyanobacterium LEGE 11480]|uniref:Phosphodiester glycosidase family protein n=1 Tax=Romeriopsis navalis LEGE 11480 TaxID=2777977 RepID=A0A928Z472_9CYAN|nr:phosphodiester glycosidase family protein [Romeriopsis navalis]MBE9029975.1 phosphodiester glycosidase family protein [Romeriopsis navalis LEGE 11480]
MGKRAPHHFTEWVVPLASSICLITGGLWLANQLAGVGERPTANLRDLPIPIASNTKVAAAQTANGAIALPQKFSSARPIPIGHRKIAGEQIYLSLIDLTDPEIFLGVGLAHNAKQANSSKVTKGDEQFIKMVRRHRAAVTVSGTFFSMDKQKRVMGNMVSGGRFLKYSPWENYGTTLGLRIGNRPEMVTARTEGKPKWQQHWFSITAGPRLLRRGKVNLAPRSEGFTDRRMMEGKALRVAIGYPKHGQQLMLVTFLTPVTLRKEAEIMGYLGNYEAMNLDGGTSVGLAKGNKILKSANRELTNVITIYDTKHPAPKYLRDSWRTFQRGDNVVAQRQKARKP